MHSSALVSEEEERVVVGVGLVVAVTVVVKTNSDCCEEIRKNVVKL